MAKRKPKHEYCKSSADKKKKFVKVTQGKLL